MSPPKVLVIEDDHGSRDALAWLLSEDGYAVRTAASGIAGLACAREFQPDAIVCDYYLPDLDGLQVLRRLRAAGGGAFIIVITAGGCGKGEEQELRMEADVFLDKPVDLSQLRSALQRIPGAGGASRRGAGVPQLKGTIHG
jgi:two-component system OmpR family response regulator